MGQGHRLHPWTVGLVDRTAVSSFNLYSPGDGLGRHLVCPCSNAPLSPARFIFRLLDVDNPDLSSVDFGDVSRSQVVFGRHCNPFHDPAHLLRAGPIATIRAGVLGSQRRSYCGDGSVRIGPVSLPRAFGIVPFASRLLSIVGTQVVSSSSAALGGVFPIFQVVWWTATSKPAGFLPLFLRGYHRIFRRNESRGAGLGGDRLCRRCSFNSRLCRNPGIPAVEGERIARSLERDISDSCLGTGLFLGFQERFCSA